MLILIATLATACDASHVLESHPTVVEYCARCGDQAPGLPHVAEGVPADVTSTYVKTSETRFENLALLAGCTVDVSVPSLRILDETPSGILIVPDTAAVEPAPPPFVAPPAPVMVLHEEKEQWRAFVAGGVGGALAAGTLIMWLATRRRRDHEPRASRLV